MKISLEWMNALRIISQLKHKLKVMISAGALIIKKGLNNNSSSSCSLCNNIVSGVLGWQPHHYSSIGQWEFYIIASTVIGLDFG